MLTLCLASLVIGRSAASPTPFSVASQPIADCRRQLNSTYRWFLLVTFLQDPTRLPTALAAIDQAAAAGYNGVILQDSTLQSIYPVTSQYKTALNKVLAESKKVGLEVIPSILPTGNGSELLVHDPTLVESMPVQSVEYIVRSGKLQINEPQVPLANQGFEYYANGLPDNFLGFTNSDSTLNQDTKNYHSGKSSLRIDGQVPTGTTTGGAWYEQGITVKPWHQYRLTLWSKAAGTPGSKLYLNALAPSLQRISFMPNWQSSSGWVQNLVVFNSQANTNILIQIGAKPVAGASIWVDDLNIVDVGLINVTRRANCPLTIQDQSGTLYHEGKDVNPISDPHVPAGLSPGAFDTNHASPVPTIPTGSNLKSGKIVYLSFEAAAVVLGTEVAICFSEPKVQTLITQEIQEVISLFHPSHLLLDTNESRVEGWDPLCVQRGLTGGQILGAFLQQEVAIVQKASPTTNIVLYSDMFDPYCNSQAQYYLANGGTLGTSSLLPANPLILNWNFKQPTPSLSFFSQLGLSQILFGYYDNTDSVLPIGLWASVGENVPGVEGFAYVSWLQDFSELLTFSRSAIAAVPRS